MLCYAWHRLDERDVVDVGSIDSTELVDLFARVLIAGTRHLIRRGFDRGYLAFAEDTSRVRGKVAFAESAKRNLFSRARAHCEFDELDHNTLHNRILKTTLLRLSTTQELAKELKGGVRDLLRWLSGVEPIRLSPRIFRRVQLHRNNHYYGFLLNVCEFIYDHLLVDDQTGQTRFMDFLQDDRMAMVFQDFVRNFYLLEQTVFDVTSLRVRWQAEFEGEEAESHLPAMQTDVCLKKKDRSRNIILECKYSKRTLVTHRDKDRLHSDHLYQLFAYLKNKEVDPGWGECEGILLYPVTQRPLDLRYRIHGHQVRVATINLNQHWQRIEKDMLGIIGL